MFVSYVFQRDEILQARAASCALPRHKPTTPAKATGHEKGGKLTAHPGTRGAKSTGGKQLFKGGKKTPSHGAANTHAKTTARSGKVTGGAKPRVAAAFKKAAAHAASKKAPASHARPAVKARRK